ncbi:peptidase, partial [Priestia megaterium]
MKIQQSIHNWMTEHRQSAVRLLKRFVEEASVQGSEKHAQAIVIERLRQLQLDIDIWEPDEKILRSHEA